MTCKFFRLQRTHFLQSTSWLLLLYHKFSLIDALKKLPLSDDSEFNKIKTLPTYCRRSVPKSTSREAFLLFLVCNTAFLLFSQVTFASVSSTDFLMSVDCCFSLVHLIWQIPNLIDYFGFNAKCRTGNRRTMIFFPLHLQNLIVRLSVSNFFAITFSLNLCKHVTFVSVPKYFKPFRPTHYQIWLWAQTTIGDLD